MPTHASRILAALTLVLASVPAAAEVPPDYEPGTICFTPDFWCWAPSPGAPGEPCVCPTGGGLVQGVLG